MRRKAPLLLTSLLVGLGSLSGAAQDSQWLKKHDRGKRSEGFLDRPNASRSLTLLGFFGYREAHDFQPSDVLHIAFYQPTQESVYIRAKELRSRSEYFMAPHPSAIEEHPPGWSHFDDWPVRDFLLPERVPLSNLGIVIRLSSDNEYSGDLAPAVLYTTTKPAAIETYTLYLTVSRALSELMYTLEGSGNVTRHCFVDPTKDEVCRTDEQRVQQQADIDGNSLLRLRFATVGLPPGPITIRLNGRYANSDGILQANFQFFNSPKVQ